MRTHPATSDLLSNIFVLGLGFAAGMQLGKIAPLIGRMQAEMEFSLTFAGWLASLLGLFVALAAYPATRLVARVGSIRSLWISASIMIIGAAALGLSPSPGMLIASRGVEAAGYVVLVIAAPSYLATHSPPPLRGVFLALWGSFVPIGYALANLQVGVLPDAWSTGSLLLSFAIPMAMLLLLVRSTTSADTPSKSKDPAERLPVPIEGWALAIAFGLYVYLSIGFFTFLPEYLAFRGAGSAVSAALVALCVPLGNFATAALLAGQGSGRARALAPSGFIAAAIAASLLYSSLQLDTLAMPVFAFAGGVAASSIFAQVPRVATSEAEATSIIGAVAQFGGIATLLGPPAAGFLVEVQGWNALAWSYVGIAVGGTSLLIFATGKARTW